MQLEPGSPGDWLRYAKADLALASVPLPEGVLYEQLCFHAQQAAEKAIKAVLVGSGVPFPRTHNIAALLESIPDTVSRREDLAASAELTQHATLSRYPGSGEPADEGRHRKAIRLAEGVVRWAEEIIGREDMAEEDEDEQDTESDGPEPGGEEADPNDGK